MQRERRATLGGAEGKLRRTLFFGNCRMAPADEEVSRLEPAMKLNVRSVTARSEFRFAKPAASVRSGHARRTAAWVFASVVWVLAGCGGAGSSGHDEAAGGESGNSTGAFCERSLCDADYDACVSREEYADCIADCDCYTLDFSYRQQCQLLCNDKCSSRKPNEAQCLSQRAACRRTARDSECASFGAAGGGAGASGG